MNSGIINFLKIQGSGNDFIVIDKTDISGHLDDRVVEKLCDRHFGIGADGIIICSKSEQHDLEVTFINPDGTEAEMCGNGIRCAALYLMLKDRDTDKISNSEKSAPTEFTIVSKAGVKNVVVTDHDGVSADVSVDMGVPEFTSGSIPTGFSAEEVIEQDIEVEGHLLSVSAASMGNPHAVIDLAAPLNQKIFGSVISNENFVKFGKLIETHTMFPRRTNVEFINILSENEIKVRVWERGAGETLACGTGACAVFALCERRGMVSQNVTVYLPGGPLNIGYAGDRIIMKGPAELVFSGSINLQSA